MALIRLQNKVPNIYVDESRDFQLLCRLYDIILNGIKYDTDGVARLTNTRDCKSNILQLLQTKLGFFSSYTFTDDMLRTILSTFATLVKSKGTKEAIYSAVYVYLKTLGLETTIKVDVIEKKPTEEQKRLYGTRVTDHSIVIGISSLAQEVQPLREILKYIIPFGYNIFFYFFVNSNELDIASHQDLAQLVLISNDINSAISGTTPVIPVTDMVYTRAKESDLQRKEYPYSEAWNSDTAQYQSDFAKEVISAINMVETGVSEAMEVSKNDDGTLEIIAKKVLSKDESIKG